MTGEPLMIRRRADRIAPGPMATLPGSRPTSAAMTAVSLELFRRGHLPVMGEWFALPLIEEAATDR